MKILLEDYNFNGKGIIAETLEVRYHSNTKTIELAFFDKDCHYVDGVVIDISQIDKKENF